ncbi:hypothetical protein SCLCIDRAFT_64837, partial [Scleroderma citrinum Foug A]
IRAKPKVTACGCKPGSPAKFDMAFVWDEEHQPAICITQVHVIFKLPGHLSLYPHPPAYVKWFTSL